MQWILRSFYKQLLFLYYIRQIILPQIEDRFNNKPLYETTLLVPSVSDNMLGII
jgi:hypothetical protein